MKKLLAILLAAVMCLSLVACGETRVVTEGEGNTCENCGNPCDDDCVGNCCESCAESMLGVDLDDFEDADLSVTDDGVIDADAAQARREILQKYRDDDSVKQMLIVSHTTGWNAKAYFYEKSSENNAWELTFETDALIGKNGMNKTGEGDAKTPCGDYAITGAFGILSNPGTALSYTNVTPTTFACDEECEYYNQIIDTAETGHECKGEEMYKLSPEYNYGLTTDYNADNTYPNGSAIFIHCKGQKPFTGGCVALDQEYMEMILKAATPGMRVYLDEYYVQ